MTAAPTPSLSTHSIMGVHYEAMENRLGLRFAMYLQLFDIQKCGDPGYEP
jgi:hypothetical protein